MLECKLQRRYKALPQWQSSTLALETKTQKNLVHSADICNIERILLNAVFDLGVRQYFKRQKGFKL